MFDPKEEEFLNEVRRLAEIGYGRMIQIISYEWSEKHPARGAMEAGLKASPSVTQVGEFLADKRGDPLAKNWERFEW